MIPEYFNTPQFQLTALHVMTCLEVPVHIFGTYCILFRTPESMKSVKWSMFNLHFWSMFLDLGISFFTTPFVLFPALAGYPLGVLKEFGVSTAIQIYFIVMLFAIVGVAVLTIFENRYYLLFAETTWWRYVRMPFLIANYFMAFIFFIPPYLYIPNQHSARETILKELPKLPEYIVEDEIFVISVDITYPFISVFSVTVIIVIEVFIFINIIRVNMNKRAKTLSQKTNDLQRKFLKALRIQVYMPLFIIIAPLSWIGLSVFLSIYNQAFNNFAFVIVSIHGLSSTIIMLLIHKPYREVCLQIFCFLGHSSSKTSPKFESRRNSNRTSWNGTQNSHF